MKTYQILLMKRELSQSSEFPKSIFNSSSISGHKHWVAQYMQLK